MYKVIAAENVPSLNISVGDTLALDKGTLFIDSILLKHSGMTFYNRCYYEKVADVAEDVFTAIHDAFEAGLELGYAQFAFRQFLRIFDAQTIGDVNRAMAVCRAMI